MTYLLDTHAFLWFVAGDARLSGSARSLVEDPANAVLLSIASVWEMAIKISLGKLRLSMPIEQFLREHADGNGIRVLGITVRHAGAVERLPFHHRDPFDRMLIAQAQAESIPVVGADAAFDAYGVRRVW